MIALSKNEIDVKYDSTNVTDVKCIDFKEPYLQQDAIINVFFSVRNVANNLCINDKITYN